VRRTVVLLALPLENDQRLLHGVTLRRTFRRTLLG
jgi:hypothetical protein